MKRLVLVSILLLCAAPAFAAHLYVSAAASLSDVLREIGTLYETRSGQTLVFNFGASSILARQIEEGAPGDLFISADELKMNQLQRQGLIVNSSRRSILSNSLVIIVASDSHLMIKSAAGLADSSIRNVAVAEPQSVPAGIYAKEYLRKLHVWGRITNKLIPTENVRGALAAVESGNVDAAIVYKTDALISRLVRIAYEVPMDQGPKISYPAAVLADSRQPAAAQRFLDFLQSAQARQIFRRYGFVVNAPD